MKLVHVPTCPCTPTSLSAPPTVLPPSGSCSRSVARACSHAERLPQGSLKRCCLLGPPSEGQHSDLRLATDIVLVEDGKLIYWPRTGEQFANSAYAMARVQATVA